jgi:hypothetical protein
MRKYVNHAMALLIMVGLLLVSCGKKETPESIAAQWCELNLKEYTATTDQEKESALAAKQAFEKEVDDKYFTETEFYTSILNQMKDCEAEIQNNEESISLSENIDAETADKPDSAKYYDQFNMKAASELNEYCPIMVDKETRLDNAMALPGNIIQYHYTLVNMEKAKTDISQLDDKLSPTIINIVKTNPDMKIFRDQKATVGYYYKDKNGEFLFEVLVTPDLYAD